MQIEKMETFNYQFNFIRMNKKRNYAKKALLGVLLCGLAGPSFIGCKDYDDDIDDLQKQITENKEAIAANKKALDDIQAAVKAGAILSSVEKTNDGIIVKLSNGQSYPITNGLKGDKGDQGDSGKDAVLPTFTIEDGLICADGTPISDVKLPTIEDFSFEIDPTTGELVVNGTSLGVVVGKDGQAGHTPDISFEFEGSTLVVKIDEKEISKDLKGEPGPAASLDGLKFEIDAETGILKYSKDGGITWTPTSKVTGADGDNVSLADFHFSIDKGVLYLGEGTEKKEVGNILKPEDFTVAPDGYLNVFGAPTGIQITNSYMIKSETEVTICLPGWDVENSTFALDKQGNVVYETVSIPVSLLDGTALKAITLIPFKEDGSFTTDLYMKQFCYKADADHATKLLTTTRESKLRVRVFPNTYDLVKANEKGLITFQAESGYASRAVADRPSFTISKVTKVEEGLYDVSLTLDIPEAKDYPATLVVDNIVASFNVLAGTEKADGANVSIQAFQTVDGERSKTSLPSGQQKIEYQGTQPYVFDLEAYWKPAGITSAEEFPYAYNVSLEFVNNRGKKMTAAEAAELGFAIDGMKVTSLTTNTSVKLDNTILVVIYVTTGEGTSLGTLVESNPIEFKLVRPGEVIPDPTVVFTDNVNIASFAISGNTTNIPFKLDNKLVWAEKLGASVSEFEGITPTLEVDQDLVDIIGLNSSSTGFEVTASVEPGVYDATLSYTFNNKVVKVVYHFKVTSFTTELVYTPGFVSPEDGFIYVNSETDDQGIAVFRLDLGTIVSPKDGGYTLSYINDNADVNVTPAGVVTLKKVNGKWAGFGKQIVLKARVMKGQVEGETVTLKPIVFNNPLPNGPVLNAGMKATLKNVIGEAQILNVINFFNLKDIASDELITKSTIEDEDTYTWNATFAKLYGVTIKNVTFDVQDTRLIVSEDKKTISWTGTETTAEFTGITLKATITLSSDFWLDKTVVLDIAIEK